MAILGYIEISEMGEIISSSGIEKSLSPSCLKLLFEKAKATPAIFDISIGGYQWNSLPKEHNILLIGCLNKERASNTTIYLESILQHVPSHIYWKNCDFVYIGCNQLFANAAGLENPNEVIGKTDYDLPWANTEADLFREDDMWVLEGHEKLNYEEPQLQADGRLIYALASKIPLKKSNGEIIGILGVYSDITELKHAMIESEQAKEKAEQANQAKSLFLASVSHELRTPLNGILGIAQVLKHYDLSDNIREHVDIIQNSGMTLLTLVNDLLDLSKLENTEVKLSSEEFSIQKTIQNVIAGFKHLVTEKPVELSYRIDDEIPLSVKGDRARFCQIITNLLGNAIKFTHEGGVALQVKLLKVNKHDVRLGFEVKDTGIGIPKNKLESIFERFNQVDNHHRRYQGTGLGLAITKHLVEAMGGKIEVKSAIGKGSTFSFSVKLKKASETKVGIAEPQAPYRQPIATLNVLVVEDNKVNQKVMGHMLGNLKQRFDIAETVAEGFALFKQNHYDMVLMDLSLPDTDGLTAARQFIQYEKDNNLPHVPIFACTAHAYEDDQEQCIDAGVSAVLTKPILEDKLAELLSSL